MSYIYEVLIKTSESLTAVASIIASALGAEVSDDQSSINRVLLEWDKPVVVGSASYVDEGERLQVSRYNFKAVSWDPETASEVFAAIAAATDWPIALFNEELYQITKQRGPLAVSA